MAYVSVANGAIYIEHDPKKSPYQIDVTRCDTYPKIVNWVVHLTEKNWCTSDIIHDFVETACSENGLDYLSDGAA